MELDLRTEILLQIKPTEKEISIKKNVCNELIDILTLSISKMNLKGIDIFIGGSFGKGTFLKQNSDIDLFMRFPKNFTEDKIESLFIEIIRGTMLNFVKQKGSRDYYDIVYKDIKFEVIPTRKISKPLDMKNSTDVSPLHVNFVKEAIKKNEGLADEIRLAKQFFKAKKFYGAESYIQGFSGHVIDILIIYYGSLENLLNNAKVWTNQKVIDVCKYYANNKLVFDSLSKAKLSPLIVIDPIDKNRNAAKALSKENYFRFIFLSKNFKSFVLSDFKIVRENISDKILESVKFAKKSGLSILIYRFILKEDEIQTRDIMGSKLLRLFKIIGKELNKYEFNPYIQTFYPYFERNEVIFIYLLERVKHPKIKKVIGPSVLLDNHIKKFVQKHSFYLLSDDKLYTFVERKVQNLTDLEFVPLNLTKAEDLLNKRLQFIKQIKTKIKSY